MKKIEKIEENNKIFAIVLRKEFDNPGVSFFSPSEFSQQLGMLIHKKGKKVERHRHKLVRREIIITQEVLTLLEGKIRIDLFTNEAKKLKSVVLTPGDTILLARGGHTVEILEDSKIIEIKQGPYAGFDDKEYF